MQRFDIPRTGNWATAIIDAIKQAEDGDEIMVHSHAQERLAVTKLKKNSKDISVVHAGHRWRRVLLDPDSDDTPQRLLDSLKGDTVED